MKMTLVRYYITSCLFALLLVPFVALPGTVSAQTSSPDVARIDALITSHMQADHIPGVAVVIVNGSQVIHQRGFGIADSTGRAVTPQTPFLLGSITKSFTALAIMQLVEAGKIDLDAPVQLYLPWFHVADRNASTQITVRNLMNHTSGMPTGAGETAALRTETMEQFVHSLGTVKLTSPVGKAFHYCNANYITLGLLIQTVSGQEYGTYIQRNILTPLGMQHSYVSVPQAQRHGLAQGYHWLFGMPTPVDDPDLHYPALLPAGLLISSAEDLSHYLVAQMNGGRYNGTSVLSSTDIRLMQTPAITAPVFGSGTAYGMGWITGPVGGIPAVWHDGITGAFHTDLGIEPQHSRGAILLFNSFTVLAQGAYEQIEAGVARLLDAQEPMSAGLSLSTFYLLVEFILALLSLCSLWSILRLNHWIRRFALNQRYRILRASGRLFWELAIPLLLLFGIPTLTGVGWFGFLYYQQDITIWLLITCVLMLITGITRAVLLVRVLRRKQVDMPVKIPLLTLQDR
ncbi:MAG: serine hydrolase domain-containing protein [Ktedonobacteraceae bacterium]